jgi:hypothetical protein
MNTGWVTGFRSSRLQPALTEVDERPEPPQPLIATTAHPTPTTHRKYMIKTSTIESDDPDPQLATTAELHCVAKRDKSRRTIDLADASSLDGTRGQTPPHAKQNGRAILTAVSHPTTG